MESGYTKSSLLFLLGLQIGDCLLLHFVQLFCLWVRVDLLYPWMKAEGFSLLSWKSRVFPSSVVPCGSLRAGTLLLGSAWSCWPCFSYGSSASLPGSFWKFSAQFNPFNWSVRCVTLGERGVKWGQSLWCHHLLLYLVKAPWGISCLEKRAGGRRCTKTNSAFQEMGLWGCWALFALWVLFWLSQHNIPFGNSVTGCSYSAVQKQLLLNKQLQHQSKLK